MYKRQAKDLGERLLHIITGQKNALNSNLLEDGDASLMGFTHGHWVRGFDRLPLADENNENKYAPFSTSFKDFFENLVTTYNVGVGVEKKGFKERVVIEKLDYFYTNKVTIKLPNRVKNLKVSIAKEFYYSSLNIGYTKGWENEEAMGLDEYNTQSGFATCIGGIKNKYSKVSKYIGAVYSREFSRCLLYTSPSPRD